MCTFIPKILDCFLYDVFPYIPLQGQVYGEIDFHFTRMREVKVVCCSSHLVWEFCVGSLTPCFVFFRVPSHTQSGMVWLVAHDNGILFVIMALLLA